MDKSTLLIASCVAALLTSCAPDNKNENKTAARNLNERSQQQFGIDMLALSYLISGQRAVRLEDQQMLAVFKEDAPLDELEAAGYVSISTDPSGKKFVVIQRTSSGDRVHDLFAARVAP